MLKKYYLGRFFWAPIPHKWYQNTSEFAAAYYQSAQINPPILASSRWQVKSEKTKKGWASTLITATTQSPQKLVSTDLMI